MTAPRPTDAAVQKGALSAYLAAVATDILRWGRNLQSAVERLGIRGQLGPSVGYPHDRRPEPPF